MDSHPPHPYQYCLRLKRTLVIFLRSDFVTYNVDTHEISVILDGNKKDCDQGEVAWSIILDEVY